MVAKNAADRYQTMSEVVADLQECLASGSTVGGSTRGGSNTSVLVEPESTSGLSFLKGASVLKKSASHTALRKKPTPPAKAAGRGLARRGQLALAGGGLLGLVLLAGVLFKLRTQDGTLVVEIDQPDAVVEVLNAEGKVEITQPGGKGTVSISVDPGKHRLKIEKDGFVVYGQDFEIESGGKQSIKATLEEDKPWFKPEFKQWEQRVSAMPAERQVDAVSTKLRQLNPGFDGKLAEQVEAGVVTAVSPLNDRLVDISPLRAFAKLKTLQLHATDPNVCQLTDLSPLTGMQITDLRIGWSKVTDLTPINKLPLQNLQCRALEFADLSPLAGMALTSLDCVETKVANLSPLAGMALTSLDCAGTKVSDLSPLKNMPLTYLNFSGTTVSDLSPLSGMPLTQLKCASTPVSDLAPLQGTKLTLLHCPGTKVRILSPLSGLPLTSLMCNGTQVSDLSPLAGMKLTDLWCAATTISDLSPLRGMPLLSLDVGGTSVSDLKPLQGMPLTTLNMDRSQVADLSLLRGMPLRFLSLDKCSLVTDISPLNGMPLIYLHLSGTKVTPAGVAALRKTLPNQCDIQWDEPPKASQAWETPAFRQWVNDVAALPPEEQVKAVGERLKQLNPQFNGKLTDTTWNNPPKIEQGAVTELALKSDGAADISPLRLYAG